MSTNLFFSNLVFPNDAITPGHRGKQDTAIFLNLSINTQIFDTGQVCLHLNDFFLLLPNIMQQWVLDKQYLVQKTLTCPEKMYPSYIESEITFDDKAYTKCKLYIYE